jgi:long-chain acyl-CoA synthetase
MAMNSVIGTLAQHAAQRWGERPAIAFPGVRELTFAEIDLLAGRFAGGLAGRGIGLGDRVVLYLPNSWQWVIAYHALARLGAVVVPANIVLSAVEVSFLIENSGARAVILDAGRVAAVGRQSEIIAVGAREGADDRSFDVLLGGEYHAPRELTPDTLFTIGYTSGTTGKPKGAMLSHGNVFASVAHTTTIHVRHSGDRIYSALPFPHVYGNVVMNGCFMSGGWLDAPARFEAGAALAAIAAERITLFEGVPTMYYQMLAHADLGQADLSSLTRCTVGGQTMPVAKLDAVVKRFGCPILELWGMTEVAGPATSHSPYWPARHGSIGLPLHGVDLRIRDPEGHGEAASGVRGELLIRGDLVTSGYWNNAAATAGAFDVGWFATGDIAYRDEDGFFYIVDRKKDVILTAGYNVYPAELEQVIAMHPAVAMVAVAGFPHDEKGEIAKAFVVLHTDAFVSEADLVAHCRKHLAAYKVPRAIRFVDDLPRTGTGKILRRELAALDTLPIQATT